MKKRIDTTKEMRQKAMKVFHVTEQTVFNAICFDSKRGRHRQGEAHPQLHPAERRHRDGGTARGGDHP